MNSVQLIQQQLQLEYLFNSDGFLVPFPSSTEQARFIIYRHSHTDGYVTYFRHDLPRSIREALATLPPEHAFTKPEAIKQVLAEDAVCGEVFVGESCAFSHPPPPAQFPDVVKIDETPPVFAVIISERIISACKSIRENDTCAEAYVYTEPEFQRRGYGLQTTAAWANDMMKQGRIPFYSYAADNTASRALARRLGLTPYAAVVAYD